MKKIMVVGNCGRGSLFPIVTNCYKKNTAWNIGYFTRNKKECIIVIKWIV